MKYIIENFPGREIEWKDQKYLYFGGTAYLGLQTDEIFQNTFINNTKRYGTNYGASRNSNVQIAIFDEAEKYLARITGSKACLTLSSGYLAGQFVSQYLTDSNHRFFYAPNTHSALYQIKAKPYVTFSALNIAVRAHLESKEKSVPVIFLDSIDFSGNNYPDFKGLESLPLEEIILVADDSHGIGIVGKNGGGVYEKLKSLRPKELIICCSLGKGYGVQAGAVLGTKERIFELMRTDFFSGASPPSPAGMATLLESENIYEEKRIILANNIRLFINEVKNINQFKNMFGHPAFSFTDESLTRYLEKKGILVTNFKYPNEQSNLKSRIVLSAAHTKEDIKFLAKEINSFLSV